MARKGRWEWYKPKKRKRKSDAGPADVSPLVVRLRAERMTKKEIRAWLDTLSSGADAAAQRPGKTRGLLQKLHEIDIAIEVGVFAKVLSRNAAEALRRSLKRSFGVGA